jgi:outer membrane murein-binding lipoprotein Lpp
VSGGLGGTGLIADDLYLMAHHETSGRPFLQPRPLGIGLAGALLAELVLGGHIVVGSDSAVAAGPTSPGADLARQIRNQIAGEPEPHVVLEWLLFLGQSVTGGVGRRLERAGYLIPAGRRVPWRPARWVPADPDWAFAPLLRARPATDATRPLTAHAAILAGLAAGCGLRFRLDQYLPAAGRSIEQAVSQLTPDLRQLDGAVQAAVAGAVLAHRT